MQNLNGQKRNKVTMKKLVVIGSSNMDLVVSTEHFPLPSQTVMGNKFMTNFGGKGANQAVAASLLGGDVTFICKVGNDNYGREMIEKFQKDGIDTQYVTATDQAATGIAVITVDANGENTIVVASGANGLLASEDIRNAEPAISQADVLLMQRSLYLPTCSGISTSSSPTRPRQQALRVSKSWTCNQRNGQ